MDKDKRIPSWETLCDLSVGDFDAAKAVLNQALSGQGGRIFRCLKDSPRENPGYPKRVAGLLINNGVKRCISWEDAYEAIFHVKIKEVEKFLGVKFSDRQKLGPLRRIPYYESTLTNASGKILVPVYPVSLGFLMGKFPALFDKDDFRKSPLLEGFPRNRKIACRWVLFSWDDKPMDYEEVLKDPRWVSHKNYSMPGVTELIYILTLLVAESAARDSNVYRPFTLYNPAARTRDCTPAGQVISVTFREDEGFALSVVRPPGQGYPVGDYPLINPDVPTS